MALFDTGAAGVDRDATAAAAARQGRASNLTGFIDNIFADPRREQQTVDFMGALRTQLGDTTNRGFADTARRNKFATARQGLTGGRVDVDRQQRTLQDLFRRRISDEAQVQDAGTGLRTQDQATRQSLLNSAYGTADVGQDALRRIIGQQSRAANSMNAFVPELVSDIGSSFADAYRRRRQTNVYDSAAGGL